MTAFKHHVMSVFADPALGREFLGIADDDLLSGRWQKSVVDPRGNINDLRQWFIADKYNGQFPDGEEYRDLISDLIQQAIAAVAIGALAGNSNTIRFIFSIFEQEGGTRPDRLPGPVFVESFQLMLLAAKPEQREEIMKSVLATTGISDRIVK